MENFPNNNTDARKEDGSFLGKATWVSREPITIGKEYFELEYEFAKILSEKTDSSLLKIIDICTPLLRTYIYIFKMTHIQAYILEMVFLKIMYFNSPIMHTYKQHNQKKN